ncbi:uncharacterized protein LOC142624203 [Castanea sativa]|uniref:uncharacterized protein LOC142624203 n=1 Tax=Castanea sativa TaxID=21020 RepID=UPI003F65106C
MTELAFSVAEKVIEKLGSLAYSEISLTRNIASDLKKLKLTMSTIQAVLLDAEEKQMKNRGLSVWLEQLKDVFHDAMDVLDEFECEDLRRQAMKTHGSTSRKVLLGDCSFKMGYFFALKNAVAYQFSNKMQHRRSQPSSVKRFAFLVFEIILIIVWCELSGVLLKEVMCVYIYDFVHILCII